MTSAAPRPFTFDTVFDGDRVIAPPKPKRAYTPEEVEAIRAECRREGETSAVARAEAECAAALGEIARAVKAALPALARVAHDHRTGSAELALACGRAIADAALDHFPESPSVAALQALSREIEAQPKLVVRCAPDDAPRMTKALEQAADSAGHPGQIVVKTDSSLPRAAFQFDWGEGRAAFDPDAAAARVADALQTALAAEGLHAEPLISAQEGDS
jgi:flagellar assembly protein FliH